MRSFVCGTYTTVLHGTHIYAHISNHHSSFNRQKHFAQRSVEYSTHFITLSVKKNPCSRKIIIYLTSTDILALVEHTYTHTCVYSHSTSKQKDEEIESFRSVCQYEHLMNTDEMLYMHVKLSFNVRLFLCLSSHNSLIEYLNSIYSYYVVQICSALTECVFYDAVYVCADQNNMQHEHRVSIHTLYTDLQ